MANIAQYLQAIMNAVYGEEVRGSIHDAIDIINKVGEVLIDSGTAVTATTSPVTGYYDGSYYLNTDTDDLWKCTGTAWALQCNLRGASIQSIVNTGTVGLVDTYTITLTNNQTFTFTVTNGRGISSIVLSGSLGLVDTYTITYNNGTTSTFTVTNGYSPTITIGTKAGRDQPVTFTDINGSETIHIMDGVDGDNSNLDQMGDVNISSATTDDLLMYDGTTQKWKNLPADSNPSLASNRPLKNSKTTALIGVRLGPVSKIIGDTSVTFTNTNIESTSELRLLSENSTNAPVYWNAVTVDGTNHTATYTFPALAVATDFYLRVINDAYTPS